jgi:hypothetical protein
MHRLKLLPHIIDNIALRYRRIAVNSYFVDLGFDAAAQTYLDKALTIV